MRFLDDVSLSGLSDTIEINHDILWYVQWAQAMHLPSRALVARIMGAFIQNSFLDVDFARRLDIVDKLITGLSIAGEDVAIHSAMALVALKDKGYRDINVIGNDEVMKKIAAELRKFNPLVQLESSVAKALEILIQNGLFPVEMIAQMNVPWQFADGKLTPLTDGNPVVDQFLVGLEFPETPHPESTKRFLQKILDVFDPLLAKIIEPSLLTKLLSCLKEKGFLTKEMVAESGFIGELKPRLNSQWPSEGTSILGDVPQGQVSNAEELLGTMRINAFILLNTLIELELIDRETIRKEEILKYALLGLKADDQDIRIVSWKMLNLLVEKDLVKLTAREHRRVWKIIQETMFLNDESPNPLVSFLPHPLINYLGMAIRRGWLTKEMFVDLIIQRLIVALIQDGKSVRSLAVFMIGALVEKDLINVDTFVQRPEVLLVLLRALSSPYDDFSRTNELREMLSGSPPSRKKRRSRKRIPDATHEEMVRSVQQFVTLARWDSCVLWNVKDILDVLEKMKMKGIVNAQTLKSEGILQKHIDVVFDRVGAYHMIAKSIQFLGGLVSLGLIEREDVVRHKLPQRFIKAIEEGDDENGEISRFAMEATAHFINEGIIDETMAVSEDLESKVMAQIRLNPNAISLEKFRILTALIAQDWVSPVNRGILGTVLLSLETSNLRLQKEVAEVLKIMKDAGWIHVVNSDSAHLVKKLLEKWGLKQPDEWISTIEDLRILKEAGFVNNLSYRETMGLYRQLSSALSVEARAVLNPQMRVKAAYIMKNRRMLKGQAHRRDVIHLGRWISQTDDKPTMVELLSVVTWMSTHGSSEAQNLLEGLAEKILRKKIMPPEQHIHITELEEVIIGEILQSYRQNSLIPILYSLSYHPDLRVRVMVSLAEGGYIDKGYAQVSDDQVERYLSAISEIHERLHLVAPKSLVDNLMAGKITLTELNDTISQLPSLITGDYRVLIKSLASDRKLLWAAYLVLQPPFQYPGTVTISFERFRSIVKRAVRKLRYENPETLTHLEQALIESGLSGADAKRLTTNLSQGLPPLLDNSPYLDTNGRFIPQPVDVLTVLGSSDAVEQAQESFNSSIQSIISILKIHELLQSIRRGIETRNGHDAQRTAEWLREWQGIKDAIHLGADLINVFARLQALNDKIFSPEGRRRSVEVMLAQSINQSTRHILAQLNSEYKAILDVNSSLSEEEVSLQNMNVNTIARNMDKIIASIKAKRERDGLFPIEKKIISGEPRVTPVHILRIFFAALREKMGLKEDDQLFPIFKDREGHLISSFEHYHGALSKKVDLRQIPKNLYVDYIHKVDLLEFIRFSDGGHSCLASDPKLAARFDAKGIHDKEVPRFLTNATSFFLQITTEPRGGKQIGWLECWFGIDEDGRAFIGTERIYLHPDYHDRRLVEALFAVIEKILFSINVSMIAQAVPNNVPDNALESPADYELRIFKVTKLQSLQDGHEIYDDRSLGINKIVEAEFKVKFNSGMPLKQKEGQEKDAVDGEVTVSG
ncbi:MAG: hypothetical protein Q7S13_00905 [Candidatus Omnitrophota bacterium]|nr:hypothetical protein [Candidatus Omnitrophota bacterium]